MTSAQSESQARRRSVRVWLWIVAALVFALVAVGGATRLTGSGLSIVEWRPVTGVLPPFTAAGWRAEFEKYKAIPQYRKLNRGMSLEEFKVLYWWEWTHRLLGRAVGLVFLLPFLWFLWRGSVEGRLRRRLWTIFGLGALQGAVGWWMVASGLAERVSVSQYRLAFHLTLACVIFAMLVWTVQRLEPRERVAVPARIRVGATVLLVLILVQIYLGALVAGLHAGLIYNTWPLIDGAFIPRGADLFFEHPWWRNFFENTLTVQFNHRMMAYVVWILASLHLADVMRSRCGVAVWAPAAALAGAVTSQAVLGIVTLLYQAPLALALGHQIVAMLVLALAVIHAERASRRHADARIPAPLRASV